ncbi:hypothetical protein EH223_07295 [candidate division KSB1 bacterium]|nr:hypothetical protein [candidate division KSB1 bacterium]RQW04352.1 MAG: hypothetical protein EH223_07295 [candidate division KSB1 bacterium]
MPVWHKTLKERFATVPMYQQVIMVANELNRAQNMLTVPHEYRNALERALELTDFLSADARWRNKLKEVRRAREVMAMFYHDPQPRDTHVLQRCFIQLDCEAWKYLNGR